MKFTGGAAVEGFDPQVRDVLGGRDLQAGLERDKAALRT